MAATKSSGGRNAKGRRAHILAGTFRPDRHPERPSPEPPKGRPSPPKPLEGDALLEWHRMIDRLEACGTLTQVDDACVFQYAKLFSETEQAAQDKAETAAAVAILEQNLSGLSGAELVACFQEISKMRRLVASFASHIRSGRNSIRMYLVEFGMTPAARTRVQLPGGATPDDEDAELARLLAIK